MPSTQPAPKKLIAFFLKALDAFAKQHDLATAKHFAAVCGVRDSTLRDWKSGKRAPTAETIARVSNDLAAIERFLRVYPPVL